jgi:subtilase family serine protease
LTWAVTNQGTGIASGGWYDYFWFSTNGVVDANSVTLTALYHSAPLAPGGSYQATNQLTLPMARSGNFWLFVQTDLPNSVFESNKVNNVSAPLAGSFTLTPPDLAPLNLALLGGSSVVSPIPNPQVQLTWAVTNQGTGTASGGWYDYFWFSTNGVVDANSVTLTALYHSPPLAPGGSYQATNQLTLPMAGSGNFWLFVQTDLSNSVFESNKVNNLSAPLPGTFTLGTIARPTLGIRLDNGQVELFWPTNFTGYHGQKAPAIASPMQWSNFVNQPVTVGQELRLTDGPPTTRQFYRLSQ